MTTSRVFCVDCKYSIPTWSVMGMGSDFYNCKKSLDYIPVNLVTGKPERSLIGCERFRSERWYDACGPDGKLWVPKDPKKLFMFMKRVSNEEKN